VYYLWGSDRRWKSRVNRKNRTRNVLDAVNMKNSIQESFHSRVVVFWDCRSYGNSPIGK